MKMEDMNEKVQLPNEEKKLLAKMKTCIFNCGKSDNFEIKNHAYFKMKTCLMAMFLRQFTSWYEFVC